MKNMNNVCEAGSVCPDCADIGLQHRLRYFYINYDEQILKCESVRCLYPYVRKQTKQPAKEHNFKFTSNYESLFATILPEDALPDELAADPTISIENAVFQEQAVTVPTNTADNDILQEKPAVGDVILKAEPAVTQTVAGMSLPELDIYNDEELFNAMIEIEKVDATTDSNSNITEDDVDTLIAGLYEDQKIQPPSNMPLPELNVPDASIQSVVSSMEHITHEKKTHGELKTTTSRDFGAKLQINCAANPQKKNKRKYQKPSGLLPLSPNSEAKLEALMQRSTQRRQKEQKFTAKAKRKMEKNAQL